MTQDHFYVNLFFLCECVDNMGSAGNSNVSVGRGRGVC